MLNWCNNGSNEAYLIDKRINKDLKDQFRQESQIHKLLLLGAGGCGKSTVFKQMKIIQNEDKGEEPFSVPEKETYIPVIHRNIFQIFDTILLFCETQGIDLIQEINNITQGFEPDDIDFFVDFLRQVQKISPLKFYVKQKDAPKIQALYKTCPPMRSIIKRGDEYDLPDQAEYFIDNLDRIAEPDYLPTVDDILRVRVKTIGIVEREFEMEGKFKCKMVDVGGQRNERRKWIHAFDSVTIVIFIMALSEYNQELAEAEKENRMQESLNLFEEICNNKYFKDKPIILFMNKSDLFEEKLKNVPLNVFFKNYRGDNSYDDALEFVKQRFLELNKNSNRSIYAQTTCATDTKTMKTIFRFVRSTILQELLFSSGQM